MYDLAKALGLMIESSRPGDGFTRYHISIPSSTGSGIERRLFIAKGITEAETWLRGYEEGARYGSEYSEKPGKFDNDLDRALYLLAHDGPDDQCGDSSEGNGWYALMLNVTGGEGGDDMGVPSPSVKRYMREAGISFPIHAIIFERPDGIVEVTYYDSAKEAEEEWEEIERECAEMYGEED
jgi:hypothetical protein